jgi:predicted MFS family arabinose efflux permease
VADHVPPTRRVRVFSVYNLAAIFAAALGALVSGLPNLVARHTSLTLLDAQRLSFLGYALAGVVLFVLYRGLRRDHDALPHVSHDAQQRVLHSSRRIVLELSALFSLDAAGGGFTVTSILVLWLHLKFGLSAGTTATVFFAAGLLAATSQLLAPWLSRRIGLIRTMAYTHLPANVFLAAAAFAPTSELAIMFLLIRALLSQMDVPARQSFVMAVVPEGEWAAAASMTNVPRSLAAAATPLLAGVLLAHSTFGWPLVIAGVTKATYDVLLLVLYRNVPETVGARRPARA